MWDGEAWLAGRPPEAGRGLDCAPCGKGVYRCPRAEAPGVGEAVWDVAWHICVNRLLCKHELSLPFVAQ